MPIDYKRANCRLRYGVCGIRVWLLQMRPTYQSVKEFFKNRSYLLAVRAARDARRKEKEYKRQFQQKKGVRRKRIKKAGPVVRNAFTFSY